MLKTTLTVLLIIGTSLTFASLIQRSTTMSWTETLGITGIVLLLTTPFTVAYSRSAEKNIQIFMSTPSLKNAWGVLFPRKPKKEK